jgi:7-carboxy-7-deazaguanine synthase
MENSVTLIENFITWQGEGPDCGHSMLILRFKTCNLSCPWCDTKVKMRVSAEAPYLLSDIQDSINENRAGILVTGGEPTVERHFEDSILLLNLLSYPVANVESNGYKLLELMKEIAGSKKVKFIYSPKIFSDKDLTKAMIKTEELSEYGNRLYIKVVWEEGFVDTYCGWLSKFVEGTSLQNKVFLMPEGVTRADLIKNSEKVFDACEKYKFNFSSRDHIIYGFV